MKTDKHSEYDGDMTPGTLLMPFKVQGGSTVDAYEDSSMSRRVGFGLSRKDGPFLIIANLPAEQTDVTFRPTLVLTSRGQLVWVVDFMLERFAG